MSDPLLSPPRAGRRTLNLLRLYMERTTRDIHSVLVAEPSKQALPASLVEVVVVRSHAIKLVPLGPCPGGWDFRIAGESSSATRTCCWSPRFKLPPVTVAAADKGRRRVLRTAGRPKERSHSTAGDPRSEESAAGRRREDGHDGESLSPQSTGRYLESMTDSSSRIRVFD